MASFIPVYGTKTAYNAATKDSNAVYFVADTTAGTFQIYKGTDLYTPNELVFTGTVPSGTPVTGDGSKLFIFYDGTNPVALYIADMVAGAYILVSGGTPASIDADVTTITNLILANFKTGVVVTTVGLQGTATDTKIATELAIAKAIGAGYVNVTIDTDYKMTFTNREGSTKIIDLPLESVIQSMSYSSTTHKLTLTLVDGTTTDIDLSDLVNIYTGASTTTTTVTIASGAISVNVKISAAVDNILSDDGTGLYVEPLQWETI